MNYRRLLIVAAAIVAALLFAVCIAGKDDAAVAATAPEEPPAGTSFTIQLAPTNQGVTLDPFGKATRKCYYWRYARESHDGWDRLRFGWGREDVACTNIAATKWVALPQFDPSHYLGYWEFDWQKKNHSQLGYSWLQLNSTARFYWHPAGFPLVSAERDLRCKLIASTHTAFCTITY